MLKNLLKPIASLRLTVVCLGLALVLVFGGTIAQVHLGLYEVQARYFRSLLVFWTPEGSHLKIPIFPGGWLIGAVLVVNLIAGHFTRFKLTRDKVGIWIAHMGIIFMLLGQFFTEAFQNESHLRIEVGETRSYSEDGRKIELAIIDTTDPAGDEIVSVPETTLASKAVIQPPKLPFSLRVKRYLPNSAPCMPNPADANVIAASQGAGKRLSFSSTPTTAAMDRENSPSAQLEIVSDKGPIGTWVVSTWLSRPQYVNQLREQLGDSADSVFGEPQGFTLNGHTYQLALRPTRYYKPYTLKLKEFRHDLYPGTDIPKNFSSLVHLDDPSRGENRDILIRMNNPLRYHGDTYYQSSFEPGDKVSILQVVQNPAASTPYVACSLVTLGLLVQFLMHLFGFVKKRALDVAKPIEDQPVVLSTTLSKKAQS